MSFILRASSIYPFEPKLCEPSKWGGTQGHCDFFTRDPEDHWGETTCDECAASMVAHPQLFAEFMRQARAAGCSLSAVELSKRIQTAADRHAARQRAEERRRNHAE